MTNTPIPSESQDSGRARTRRTCLPRLCLLLGASVLVVSGCSDNSNYDDRTVDSLLKEATQLAAVFNYNYAGPRYRQVMEMTEPGSKEWNLAAFGAASSAWHRLPPSADSIAEAESLFNELAEAAPVGSDFWARAMLSMARIVEITDFPGDQADPARAREIYLKVMEAMPASIIADEAAGRLAANSLFDFERPEIVREGLDALRDYLFARGDTPIAGTLWQFLGSSYWHYLEDAKSALAALERSIEYESPNPARAWAVRFEMAWLAEHQLNDLETALRHYRWVAANAPRSPRIFEARLAVQSLEQRIAAASENSTVESLQP